jgi:hypothetical protein
MAHNQEMLEKRAADCCGKVRIIGVSIDNTKYNVLKKVIILKSNQYETKWTSVEHR